MAEYWVQSGAKETFWVIEIWDTKTGETVKVFRDFMYNRSLIRLEANEYITELLHKDMPLDTP
jgi:hypothetical protein